MAENTTSITVKVEADLGSFKDKIQEAIHEALTATLQALMIEPANITVSPLVKAEALKVGDRVEVTGSNRFTDSPDDMDDDLWWFGRGDTGTIEGIRENGDAVVRFDKEKYTTGVIALTSLSHITAQAPVPAIQVESLVYADRNQKYTDISGDTWEYSEDNHQWEYKDSCDPPCIANEHEFIDGADQFGPFDLVTE